MLSADGVMHLVNLHYGERGSLNAVEITYRVCVCVVCLCGF
jgi:hypothetical protein